MRLRLVPYRDLSHVAEAAGFTWVRRDGSHNVFRNAQGRTVVIPDHGSQVIVRPLLRKTLRGRGRAVDQHNEVLDRL
jgi:predicted RNA binding protein YcfA (HicA-like mRNA interferase family)